MSTIFFRRVAAIVICMLLLIPCLSHAAISPATVLAINTDTSNTKLYVEISYVGRPCLIYQLKFGIGIFNAAGNATVPGISDDTLKARPFKVVTGAGDDVVWRIDDDDPSNSSNTTMPLTGYITKVNGDMSGTNDTLMYDMQISGYRLEFDLTSLNNGARVLPTDSIKVCLRSQMKPIKCEGCGTAGTDRMFSLNDIAPGCPYDYDNKEDMIACYRRDSKVANWEGWIADARDCKRYRVVQMPDSTWWMAQNLNFQGTDGNKMTFRADYKDLNGATGANGDPIDYFNGLFWCPDSALAVLKDSLPTTAGAIQGTKGSLAACNTYGAFYPAVTIFIVNGKSTGNISAGSSDLMPPTLPGDSTTFVQGICPTGWAIPSDYHWGKMINLVEKSCEDTSKHYGCTTTGRNSSATTGFPMMSNDSVYHFNPCKHIMPVKDSYTAVGRWNASVCAYKDLLSTNVAPYRELDTAATYISNTALYIWNLNANRRGVLKAPKRINRYATETNPVWSYYTPETAGTDKYGFSILPAGHRYYAGANSSLFGEFAGFWSSTASASPIVNSDANYQMRGFLYNATLNAIMPHAIFNTEYGMAPRHGYSLRCIAEAKK